MSARARLESEVQRQIQADLGAESDLLLLRNSTGVAMHFDEDTGKKWTVPYGLGSGSPDLVGILRTDLGGLWFCLEVKCPGEKPDPHQVKCHEQWRAFGAFVETVTSVGEARAALERARAGAW